MASCESCTSEKVCRYNDGINLYCKKDYECPHFKNKADFVEVVRCEKCKRYEPYEYVEDFDGICSIDEIERDKDFYCAYGERKND